MSSLPTSLDGFLSLYTLASVYTVLTDCLAYVSSVITLMLYGVLYRKLNFSGGNRQPKASSSHLES